MPDLDLIALAVLVVGGAAAGLINTLAGGGMMVTLPLMVFLGLPETLANGTSRFGILFQATSSAMAYTRKGVLDLARLRQVVPPVLAGALVGALVGARLPNEVFRAIFGVVMIAFAALLLRKPKQSDGETRSELHPRFDSAALRWLILLPVGVYGGMIQAGMGYVVIGALTLGFRFSLMEANILKVALIGAYTPIAVLVFALNGQLSVLAGSALAVGQALGAWIGAHVALERGVGLVRAVLLAVIGVSSLHLFGVSTYLWKLLMN